VTKLAPGKTIVVKYAILITKTS